MRTYLFFWPERVVHGVFVVNNPYLHVLEGKLRVLGGLVAISEVILCLLRGPHQVYA